jgi:hypothetical protein
MPIRLRPAMRPLRPRWRPGRFEPLAEYILQSAGRARQAADDLSQCGLAHGPGRFSRWEPPDPTLPALRPFFGLTLHLERKYLDIADDEATVFKTLLVDKGPDRAAANRSDDAGLLEGFARGGTMRCFALLRPALRDDPALRITGGDEHDLSARTAAQSVGQSCVLHAVRGDSIQTAHTHQKGRSGRL